MRDLDSAVGRLDNIFMSLYVIVVFLIIAVALVSPFTGSDLPLPNSSYRRLNCFPSSPERERSFLVRYSTVLGSKPRA